MALERTRTLRPPELMRFLGFADASLICIRGSRCELSAGDVIEFCEAERDAAA